MFSLIDTLALGLYLLVMIGIGYMASRKATSFAEFMFGGSRLPWWAIGISLIATSVSASTFLGNPADAFKNNMTFMMLNIGAFLAIIVTMVVFIPRIRAANVQSAYELLEVHFGRSVRLLAATLYCFHLLLRTGVLLYGPAIVLSEIFGINIFLSIMVMAVLAVVYTYFGGLRAVVWTDVMQFVVLFGGGLVALYYCAEAAGSFGELKRLADEAGKTTMFNWSWDIGDSRTLLSAGLVYAVFELAIRGCDQQFVQRYIACRDVKEANRSALLSAVLGTAVAYLFFWLGAGLYVYFEALQVKVLPADMGVNHVFPHFILEVLPPGVTGIMVAAPFAAAMSSLDSAITALSNTTMVDFFAKTDRDDSQQLRQTRYWVLVWGVLGTLAAFLCVFGQKSLLDKALTFTSLFIGPLLGLFLHAFYRPQTAPKALIIGVAVGMLGLFVIQNLKHWVDPGLVLSPLWNPLVSLTIMSAVAAVLSPSLQAPREAT
jgi:SSS family solute:Na+ symporter